MSIRQFFLGALLVAVTTTVSAHLDGHDDEAQPITAQEASVIADHAIGALVKEKRLDGSWAKLQPQEIKPQGTGSDRIWVVSYSNPAEKDASKKGFYVFIDALGNYLDSNHSGKR